MHYCLRDPDSQVIGLRLNSDELGHDIYDILDWADEKFASYSVEQANGYVQVHSERLDDVEEIHEEPLETGNATRGADQDPTTSGSDNNGGEGGGPTAEPALE